MEEISAVSVGDMKRIGKYEFLVCTQYYPSKHSDQVDRFGSKLELNYKQIPKINQEVLKVSVYADNPIHIGAAVIYKTMQHIGIDIK